MTCRELFSKGLNRLMYINNTTRYELAKATGISYRQIGRILNSENFPTHEHVVRAIAEYYGIEESDILDYGKWGELPMAEYAIISDITGLILDSFTSEGLANLVLKEYRAVDVHCHLVVYKR